MDILDFKLTVGANRQITVPDITVSFRFVDSQTQQTTIEDASTASNKQVNFWNYLGSLSAAKKREFAETCTQWLITDRLNQLQG